MVSVGEIWKLAKSFKWGARKLELLEELLKGFVILDIGSKQVIDAYASIAYFSESTGAPKGQNDYWIAATTHVLDGVLLTLDKDFDHLTPHFIRREYIDPVVKAKRPEQD